ncbi:MAG: hypothetical protein J6X01_01410 [Bacteroidales bacterium]|nr:hypothetical protein [Bacteroidales bacterium]
MKKNIAFRMNLIKIDQFAIMVEKPMNPDLVYSIDTAIRFGMTQDTKQLFCQYKTQYRNGNKTDLLIGVSCGFEIEPNSWNGLIDGETLSVPSSFLKYMGVQTIGITRGILYEKTVGTVFDQLILPHVNLEAMITVDQQFKMSGKE